MNDEMERIAALDAIRAKRKPLQKNAHKAINHAVRTGDLLPAHQYICVDCGAPAAHYDHRDYDMPLNVEPVCAGCNVRRGSARPYRKNDQAGQPIVHAYMSMTAANFDRRVAALGLTTHCLPAARDVLVRGIGLNAAARNHGVAASQVSRTAKQIREVQACKNCGQAIP